MSLERGQNESEFNYHKRLIYGKLVDKTLADIDYSELAELVYGQSYSSDVARRMMYGSRRTLDLVEASKMDNDNDRCESVASSIDEKIAELQKERQRFFDQRREYNKLLSETGRLEHLYDIIGDAVRALPSTVGSMWGGARTSVASDSNNDAVVVFSDWHYGMTASNIFNTYNTSACKERVKHVVDEMYARLMFHGCNKLHIVVLGDMLHGAIHTSARVASEELVCDQLMQVSEILAQAIQQLSECASETVVYMTYGNHARTVANKSESIHRDNMERIIPWWLSQRLSGYENITVANPEENEFLLVTACGHEICAAHGDLDYIKTSPQLLSTLFSKKLGKNIEYVLLGDKHHRESFEELGVTAMMCGSLCGADDYANDKRLFSTPSQLLLIVNEECGVDAEYRIKC